MDEIANALFYFTENIHLLLFSNLPSSTGVLDR